MGMIQAFKPYGTAFAAQSVLHVFLLLFMEQPVSFPRPLGLTEIHPRM